MMATMKPKNLFNIILFFSNVKVIMVKYVYVTSACRFSDIKIFLQTGKLINDEL